MNRKCDNMKVKIDKHKLTNDKLLVYNKPKKVYIPLISGNDTNITILVKKGEYVYKGSIIGKRKGDFRIPIHSSVNGTVLDFEEKTCFNGEKVKCVVIENDFKEKIEQKLSVKRSINKYTKEEFLNLLMENGIVGLGGAGFPTYVKYEPKNIYAHNIGLGKFYLSEDIIKNINSITKITQLPYNTNFKIYNGFYFTGNDYDNPKIGDQKLSYSYIPSGIKLSIIAKQSGNHLENMNSKYGDFSIVMNGEKDLKTMISDYKKNLTNNTWLIRGISLLFLFLGLNLIIQPIVNLGNTIPILGELTQMAAFASTLIITIALGTLIISLAWLLFRPEIAIPLIIISILTIISLKKRKRVIIN